jgi:UDP-N-acetylglucosamine--N-acetylmuramyl-(pentapeptide) pyrophosphoryl-undecaprenol N-acetylglucosamine transferase
MKVIIAGGGTGGHLFPGIAVAETLRAGGHEVMFVGTSRGIERTAVPKAGFAVEFIDVAGLKGLGWAHRVKTVAALPRALLQARRIIAAFGADVVLGVGGYASGPVVLAAKLRGTATAICEQNSVPGLTNRSLGRIVDRVFATFPSSIPFFPAAKVVMTGNPVRAAFVAAARGVAPPKEPGMVLVFGGSQGARALNEVAPAALAKLHQQDPRIHVLHQAGKEAVDAVQQAYQAAGVPAVVTPFIDDMVAAYRRAEAVVCRAGATTCAELLALGAPALLVPFPAATDDHQTKNAMDLVQLGAATMLPQSELSADRLAAAIETLRTQDTQQRIAAAAREHGKLGAADDVMMQLLSLVQGPS